MKDTSGCQFKLWNGFGSSIQCKKEHLCKMLGLLVFHSLKCLSNRQKYIFSTHERQIEFWNINKHNISVLPLSGDTKLSEKFLWCFNCTVSERSLEIFIGTLASKDLSTLACTLVLERSFITKENHISGSRLKVHLRGRFGSVCSNLKLKYVCLNSSKAYQDSFNF